MVSIDVLNNESIVIKVKQNINFTNVEKIKDELSNVKLQSADNFIMDFLDVQIVDSAGVSFILTFYDSVRKHGKNFSIKNANSNVLHLFKLIGLEYLIAKEG